MRTSLRVFTTSNTEVCGLARAVSLCMWNTTVELIHMTTLLTSERLYRYHGGSPAGDSRWWSVYSRWLHLSLSRFHHRLTACEGHPDMMEGTAVCHLACNAASKEGTRYCTSSTRTPVISRNASGTAGQCTVHQPSRGPPGLGGIVDHQSE